MGSLRKLEASIVSLVSTRCTSMCHLKQIHAFVFRRPVLLRSNLVLAKMLRFAAVSPSGNLSHARLMFEFIGQAPNLFFWNTIIRGYAKSTTPQETIMLFRLMRRRSVAPDGFTFNFLIKACSRRATVSAVEGEVIHAQALTQGFHLHLFVQNPLIHFYSVSGYLDCARQVFNEVTRRDVVSWSSLVVGYVRNRDLDSAKELFLEMPERDVVSWTALIAGYAQNKQPKEALELFQQMQVAGVKPDEVTLISVISACAQLGDLELGSSIHSYINEKGFWWMISLCNALIDMYAKCGCIHSAKQVFDVMPRRSLLTWNSTINALAIHGCGEEALQLFSKMEGKSGMRPDGVTYLAVLSACAHMGWVEEGQKEIHAQIITNGFSHKKFLLAKLVSFCSTSSSGNLAYAYRAFNMIHQPTLPIWNHIIRGFALIGNIGMSLSLFDRMRELEAQPDSFTYSFLLKACAFSMEAGLGQEIHARVIHNGLASSSVFVQTNLINMYATGGELEDARHIFDGMLERNVVSWNAMLAAYARSGGLDEAWRLFDEMPERNVVSWTTMIAGCSQTGHSRQALALFRQMQHAHIEADQVVMVSVLSACAELGALDLGKWIDAYISGKGKSGWGSQRLEQLCHCNGNFSRKAKGIRVPDLGKYQCWKNRSTYLL
ncbi:hypothetical protein AMTR_s00010p00267800 [Amborella trichopoda]|uniref:Pentacotripeptide-repeat region of PRORP domain-containing protein n=1 Tax=Amborella trichopoda TaxID=13333 RepID=W1NFH4_AMBTC|nr:hypothetical protein AMTR_s00010p00267800 [Amborella trichopoda]